MNAFTQVRTLTRRDSCTALLKKLGVDKTRYSEFVEQVSETEFIVYLDRATAAVAAARVNDAIAAGSKAARKVRGKASAVGPDIDETETLAAQKPAKKAAAPKAAKRTVTSVAYELIRAGKSNADVWAALQKEFSLDDSKKSYPAWYRRHLRVKHGEDHSKTA